MFILMCYFPFALDALYICMESLVLHEVSWRGVGLGKKLKVCITVMTSYSQPRQGGGNHHSILALDVGSQLGPLPIY